MGKEKVIIDTGNLEEAHRQASIAGKEIESFKCDEISIVAGGIVEMGAIYDIKYKDNSAYEFNGHDLRNK